MIDGVTIVPLAFCRKIVEFPSVKAGHAACTQGAKGFTQR